MSGKSGDKGAVLITGASTGIGRATALHLDERGYRVFAGVRKKSDAESLKAEASDRLKPVTIDVASGESIKKAKASVARAAGPAGLKALINNAGIAVGGPIETLPLAEFRRTLDVNLTGAVAITQAFLPLVRKAKGTIFFITSIGGRVASPFFGAYNASKFGLEGVADALRAELVPWGIKVVVIEPGSIATPIWEKGAASSAAAAPKGAKAKLYAQGMRRIGDVSRELNDRGIPPERVAKVIGRAIESRRPKTRYLIGRDAKMMVGAKRLLGDRRYDKAVRKQMGLSDEAPKA